MRTTLLVLFLFATLQAMAVEPQHPGDPAVQAEPAQEQAANHSARSPDDLSLDLSWVPDAAHGFTPTLHMSLEEVFEVADPGKARRLSMWDAPLGRVMFATQQPEAAAGQLPWHEDLALDLVLPELRLRWVDHGPLGDWVYENTDDETRRTLLGAFVAQAALPILDSLLD